MNPNHLEPNSPKSKMIESSKYALPLVVRYETLIAFISDDIDSAVKDSAPQLSLERRSEFELQDIKKDVSADTQRVDRTGALKNVLLKLRQWAHRLSYESSTMVTAGPDVLEALEMGSSNGEVIDKIHGIFSGIAKQVQSCPQGLLAERHE